MSARKQIKSLTVSALAKTMGSPKELMMNPIVMNIAVSMHGELVPPVASACLRAIIVGIGHSM